MDNETLKTAGLRLKIDGAAEFQKSLAEIKTALQNSNTELNKIKATYGAAGSSVEALTAKKQALAGKLKTVQEQLRTQREVLQQTEQEYGANSKEAERLRAEIGRLEVQEITLTQQVKTLGQQVDVQSSSWTKLGTQLQEAGTKLKTIGDAMSNAGRNMSLYVTAPLAAAGTSAVKASVEFESAFAGVRKTVDATEEQLARLQTGIRNMAKEIPATTTEIAGVAEAAGQLGIATEDIMDFTRVMIDLGESTNLSANEAATSLAKFANITGLAAEDYGRLGSVIVDLGNNFATTEADIVNMAQRLAGTGDLVGLNEAQIMAMATALSSVGIEAEAGGSALSKLLKRIETDVATGSDRLNDFARIAGMSAEEFSVAWEQDAAAALADFINGLGELEASGGNAITTLEDMGITEVRLSNAVLALAGSNDILGEALDKAGEAWEENTALQKEAEQRYKTMESRLKIVKNTIKDTAITLGNIMMPYIEKAATAVKNFATRLAAMDEEQQKQLITLAAVAAAIGPVLITLGKLSTGVGAIVSVVGKATAAIGAAGGFIPALGALAGPVGLAVAAVAGLTGAFLLLREDAENAADPITRLRGSVSDLSDTVEKNQEQWRQLMEAQREAIDSGLAETANLELLKAELDSLVDANGRVKSGYEERAGFIVNELSQATGIEIGLVDGIIKGYDDLSTAIANAITMKRAQILLEGQEEAYRTAIQNMSAVEDNMLQAYADMAAAEANYTDVVQNAVNDRYGTQRDRAAQLLTDAQENYAALLDEYRGYNSAITQYETDQAAFLAGNYDALLERNGLIAASYADLQDLTYIELQKQYEQISANLNEQVKLYEITDDEKYKTSAEAYTEQMQQLIDHLEDMEKETASGMDKSNDTFSGALEERNKEQIRLDNYSQVQEQKHFQELDAAARTGGTQLQGTMRQVGTDAYNALNEKTSQYDSVGKEIVDGVSRGVDNNSGGLFSSLRNLASRALAAAKEALGIASPSKIFDKEVGTMIPAGVAQGIKQQTPIISDSLREMLRDAKNNAMSFSVELNRSIALAAGNQRPAVAGNSTDNRAYHYGGITVSNLVVREEADIKRIAKELYALQVRTSRGMGVK